MGCYWRWRGPQIRQQRRGSSMAQVQMADEDQPMDRPPPNDTRCSITTWMDFWYCYRRDGALLAAVWILGVGAAKSVAGGIMVLTSGKWTVLGQKSDFGGNQDMCGMLRARSTRFVWGGSPGSTVKRGKWLIYLPLANLAIVGQLYLLYLS